MPRQDSCCVMSNIWYRSLYTKWKTAKRDFHRLWIAMKNTGKRTLADTKWPNHTMMKVASPQVELINGHNYWRRHNSQFLPLVSELCTILILSPCIHRSNYHLTAGCPLHDLISPGYSSLSMLMPEHTGWHFAENAFKYISLRYIHCVSNFS